jgi:hypothetical protein
MEPSTALSICSELQEFVNPQLLSFNWQIMLWSWPSTSDPSGSIVSHQWHTASSPHRSHADSLLKHENPLSGPIHLHQQRMIGKSGRARLNIHRRQGGNKIGRLEFQDSRVDSRAGGPDAERQGAEEFGKNQQRELIRCLFTCIIGK